jgi:1-acyl-sn-glycerol-3-phosphate acyltransferase
MPELWYRLLLRITTRTYYRRVSVVNLAPLEEGDGPMLFVGLHRNGAVDGMLYKSIFPTAVFVVARRLLRSRFSRLYFTGIPVTREHDEDAATRRDNPRALEAAVDHLALGGQLFILPEGTSDLGPRHLPFKPGAAKVLATALERGITPRVVPLGIFYESAAAFRSDVCIVVGSPIDVALPPSLANRAGRVSALMERLTVALEALAVEADSPESLRRIETMAALAADDMSADRWRLQKLLMSAELPAAVEERIERLTRDVAAGLAKVDRAGVPRFSRRGALWNALWVGVQVPTVGLAWLVNVVPVTGAWLAGKRLANAPNTIALWRILVGAPLALGWLIAVVASGLATRNAWVVPAYLVITMLGLVAYPELCVRWPMLRNVFARPTIRDDASTVGQWLRAATNGATSG